MRRWIWIALSCVLWPGTVLGGPCSDFPWNVPRDMVMPELLRHGQEAMRAGRLLEARELFSTYLTRQDGGVWAEGARWVVASLPDPSDEPGTRMFQRIDRLQTLKARDPESVYAPWALCAIGDVYGNAGWAPEASAMFEEFLRSYPDDPLAGGVMVEAGSGYLNNGQYLEAALVFRRVVEEPKWKAHRLRGALGLADGTAMAKAWKQAHYWYRVVEAEAPELIRQSADSLYYFGLTELAVGNHADALTKFLLGVNLHPHRETTGLALIRISEILRQAGHDYVALWFADQACQQFPDQEPGRRGRAELTRWTVAFLSQEPPQEKFIKVYQRLEDLELYLSLSWDAVLEAATALHQAPEGDLAEESVLWSGHAYQALDDVPAAVEAYARLLVETTSESRRQEAQDRLSRLVNHHIQTFYDRKAWMPLLTFHRDHQRAFRLLPLERERALRVAEAYQQVNLPSQALHWYDQLLQEYPDSPLREDIIMQKILLAEELGNTQLMRKTAGSYLREFARGRWRGEVETALGRDALASQRWAEAIQHLSEAIRHGAGSEASRRVLRNRARAYHALGHMEAAIQDLRQVVSSTPVQIPDVIRLGDLLFDHGEYAEAERLYDQVLASEAPAAVQAWATYRLAVSLEHMGNPDAARNLLAEIRDWDTRSPELEHTIRSAATLILEEMSSQTLPRSRIVNEQAES